MKKYKFEFYMNVNTYVYYLYLTRMNIFCGVAQTGEMV